MHSLTFSDFDEFTVAVRDVDHEMMLQNLVRRHWSIRYLDAHGIHIQMGDEGSGDITEGRSRTDGYLVFLPVRHAAVQRANGVTLQSNSAVVFEPGSEFYLSARADHQWCSVFIPTVLLTQPPGEPAGDCRVMHKSMGDVKQYLGLVRRILAAAQARPEVIPSAGISDALLDLRRRSSRFISRSADPLPSPLGRPRISRIETIRRIKALLESRENQPLSTGELVLAAGVSERTLRDVFRQFFHVSPARYLQLRQLHQVYRALRFAEPDSVRVSDVLVRFGVWEFGRFAGRYRKTFGELPSETLVGREH